MSHRRFILFSARQLKIVCAEWKFTQVVWQNLQSVWLICIRHMGQKIVNMCSWSSLTCVHHEWVSRLDSYIWCCNFCSENMLLYIFYFCYLLEGIYVFCLKKNPTQNQIFLNVDDSDTWSLMLLQSHSDVSVSVVLSWGWTDAFRVYPTQH